jgi:hypothetical protein
VLTIVLVVLQTVCADYLQANYFTEADTCGGAKLAEAFIPMGKCIKAPESEQKIPFKSFTATCTQNADGSVTAKAKVFMTSSSCSGMGVSQTETIAPGCQSGGTFQCVPDFNSADSVKGAWPAIGAAFGDADCSHMDVMAAFTANTCVAVTSDGKAGSAQIDDADASYEAKVWEGATDCSDSPKKQVSIPKDTCQPINTGVKTSTYYVALEKFSHMLSHVTGCPEKLREQLGAFKGSGAPVYYYGNTADKVPV